MDPEDSSLRGGINAGQKPEGQVTEVTGYLFPRPSDPKPVPKNSFVTKVGDIYCGVGYYKWTVLQRKARQGPPWQGFHRQHCSACPLVALH